MIAKGNNLDWKQNQEGRNLIYIFGLDETLKRKARMFLADLGNHQLPQVW
ncbi:hypothetical protein HanRHA438_Chr05g0205311 [Helianthus annuus]|nr:hypothetical protein HanIR_Chr05g0211221 [Helianthus annuus]KAJ0917376.1 hypothetical protein HanRHA438_Chr05g0205311 [Helianthus annuus]